MRKRDSPIATDIATLGIRVENSQLKAASAELAQLGARGDAVEQRLRSSFAAADRAARPLVLSAKQVDAAMNELRRDIALMNAHLRTGELSQAEYARSMALTRQQVVLLGASMRNASTGQVGQFNALIAASGPVAQRSEVSMGRFRNAVANVGLASVGIHGPLGKIIETIGIMGVGGIAVTGALAGLAAVAAALRFTGQAAREAQSAYDGWVESLSTAGPLAMAGAQLDEVREKVRLLEADVTASGGSRSGNPFAAAALAKARLEVERLDAQYRQMFGGLRGGAVAAATQQGDEFVKSLQAQVFAVGKTAEQVRRHEIALARLTDTQRASAIAASSQLAIGERMLALKEQQAAATARELADAQAAADGEAGLEAQRMAGVEAAEAFERAHATAINDTARALLDHIAALEVETDALQREAAVQKQSRAVRDALRVTLAGEAAVRVAVNAAQAKGVFLTEEETAALRAAAEARAKAGLTGAAVADGWADAARSVAQLVQTLDLADDSMVLLLHNAISLGEQMQKINDIVKAGGSLAAGDLLGAATALASILSSGLLGGGQLPSPYEQEAQEALKDNTDAVRRNTLEKSLALELSGSQLTAGARGTQALLDYVATLPTPGSGGPRLADFYINQALAGTGVNWQELQDIADGFGIELDRSGWQAWLDSLKALDTALKESQLTRFAETFAGRLQALTAQWQVFDTTDPLQQLTEQLAEVSRAGTGSSAFDLAGRGPNLITWPRGGGGPVVVPGQALDLQTSAGRDQLLGNLQTLFLQLQQGTLTADQLGGLTAQEFLDQLTGMIDLIRQAEEAARANNEALQQVADTLRDFGKALRLDDSLSTLTPAQKLAEARDEYNRVLALAQTGDRTAAAELPAAARAFLQFSRDMNASGPAYAADFARVVAETEAVALMFEGLKDIGVQQLEAATSTAANTQKMWEEQMATTQVLATGFTELIGKQTAMEAAIEELIQQTKIGNEGKLL